MTEKRVQELLGQMQKTLECSICLEMMANPVSTSCGHQFCRFCLMKMLDKKREVLCPLCKKPVTKRSLMKREQLGEMIEGVRNLISAFQKDTGILFSPPRGLQASLLPGTPDVIQAKSSVVKKQVRETRQRNVRQSTRKRAEESITENSTSATESSERIPDNSDNSDKNVKGNRNERNKNKISSETNSRQQELLRCIEEGSHHAINSPCVVNIDSDYRPVGGRIKKDIEDTTESEEISVELSENLSKDKEEVDKSNVEFEEDCNLDVPILSGNSVAKGSETSSGPLFKTPVDPKRKTNFEMDTSVHKPRSLRSNNKRLNYDESKSDDNGSIKLTPEVLVVNESAVNRTYSRKDKDSFVKEKKANKKVAEWLKNIPSASESGCEEVQELKRNRQQKKPNAKSLKVVKEEEAMGSKIKHLAKQIHGKDLLFDSDDFNVHENASDAITATSTSYNEVVQGDSVADQDPDKEHKPKYKQVKDETENSSQNEVGAIKEKVVNDLVSENQSSINDAVVSNSETEGVKNPIRKKRIFKSRTSEGQLMASAEKNSDKAKGIFISTKQHDKSKASENLVSANIVRTTETVEGPPDPYEFKSSQNTPKKSIVTKRKQKKNMSLDSKRNRNKNFADIKLGVREAKEESKTDKKLEKKWDKDLIPDKTILKVNPGEEIHKITASLQQAEKYDLLTCTQEAVDKIAKDEEKLNQLNKVKTKKHTLSKPVHTEKKVRFLEPVISDFINVGKVDVIGYRKAQEKFMAEHAEIKEENCNEEKGKEVVIKCIESEMAESNLYNSPLRPNMDKKNKDNESDDLSEDYRFHDDSSGTDDLDIEPTPEQFEKPNLDIQPEEIKSQLSQVGLDVVKETPLIPVNKDLPNSLILEETPSVFCGPKFNKALSKPARKGQKMWTFSKLSVDASKMDVANNVSNEDTEVKAILEDKCAHVFHNDTDTVGVKTLESSDIVLGQEILTHETFMNKKEVQVYSDETKSPDNDLTFKTGISNAGIGMIYADNDPNMHGVAVSECVSSQSTLTQNSESILCVKTVPLKTTFTNQNLADENKVLKNTNEMNEGKDFSVIEKQNNEDTAENLIGLVIKALPKKKRKSFMLEETKESLDFGSLDECSVVDIDEDLDGVRRAKRQRVSRLRRSPKNKECTLTRKSKDDALGSKIDEMVTENVTDFNTGESESVEMIPDTVVSDSELTESTQPDSSNIKKGQANEKTEKKDVSENVTEVGLIYKESSQSNNVNSLETIDVIGETEMSNTDNFKLNEIRKKKDDNHVEGENSDYIRSRKNSKESLKQLDTDLNGFTENDVKVRHLSGVFISPQESLVLTGVKNSPENIFHIDSEMPSVDLSPDEGTVKPLNHSPSLDLVTVDSLEPVDQLELSSLEQEETLSKGNNESDVNCLAEKSHLEILARSNKIKNVQDIDSSPEEMQRKSTVKSVRGFSKKKRISEKETNEILTSDTVNDDLSRTPQSVTKRKSKSPISNELNPNVRDSVQNKIIKNEAEEQIECDKGHKNRVCLEESHFGTELNDLPDIDLGNKEESSEASDFEPILNTNTKGSILENENFPKRLKTPPKLLLKSPNKELNVVLHGGDNELEKGDNEIEDDNEDLVQSPKEEFEKEQISEDENSQHSSTSSEFRLDSSDEEECPKKQALSEISKFDKIVEDSIELENLSNTQRDKKLRTKDPYLKAVKTGMKSDCESLKEEPCNFSNTQNNVLPQKRMEDERVTHIDTENMYSTRLDSSPSVHDDAVSDSEQVILESDLDDNDESDGKGKEHSTVDDDDDVGDVDSSYEAVVRRKGVKRAIMSDSSSDDEDDNSRHLSITSSSAFSSQSENLTTQERYSLEKEVERMAREMEAMKEQLRRSKEIKRSRRSESKLSPNPVTVDDSEEEGMIEVEESEKGDDGDMLLSQPEICPSDLQLEEETVNPVVTLHAQDTHDNQNNKVEPNETKNPEETVEMIGDTLDAPTVPDTDPSHLSRQPLADLDTNVPQLVAPGKKKHIGIVVTGLNHQQIQQTKKLAALNDIKFFNKFTDQVTHVVVKPAEEDETICDRTLKFFQGISRKCWIVNFFWVVDSREVGHLLPEGPYEIQGDTANNEAHYGPKRARLSKDKLFSKFQFSLIGENTYLSKESMMDLIEACGGDVLDISQLSQGHKKSLVISCSDIDEDMEEKENITKHAREVYKRSGVVTLTREWILDSLTMYTAQPLKDYVINKGPDITRDIKGIL